MHVLVICHSHRQFNSNFISILTIHSCSVSSIVLEMASGMDSDDTDGILKALKENNDVLFPHRSQDLEQKSQSQHCLQDALDPNTGAVLSWSHTSTL